MILIRIIILILVQILKGSFRLGTCDLRWVLDGGQTKVAMADVTVCWGSIKGMVVEYVHVAAGLLGSRPGSLCSCRVAPPRTPRTFSSFLHVLRSKFGPA